MAEEGTELLKPCKNLRTAKPKQGNLVARIRKDLKTISFTYFAGFKGCKEGHFLADEYGTVEINLRDPNSISEERNIPVNRWSKEVLPQVPYSASKKYGGISEVYYGNVEDVLKVINSLEMEWADAINEDYLPMPF